MFHPTSKVSQQAAGLTIHPSLSLFDSPTFSTSTRIASSQHSTQSTLPSSSKALPSLSPSNSILTPSLLPSTGLPSSSSLTKLRLKSQDQRAGVDRDVKDVENDNQDYMCLGKMQRGDRNGKGYFSGDMEEWDDCSSEVTEMGKASEGVTEGEGTEKIDGDYEEGQTPTLETYQTGSKVT